MWSRSVQASVVLAAQAFFVANASCVPKISPPDKAPQHGASYNGIALQDVCFDTTNNTGEEHFFTIGDWGGISYGGGPPVPAVIRRSLVKGVDDQAQQLVAAQMAKRATTSKPRFVVNVGDMFYWSGIEAQCGLNLMSVMDPHRQFTKCFEEVYVGESIEMVPWLGTLGNHDYGGRDYMHGWDQLVAYTWGPGGRWVVPALYWSQRMLFIDFSVDFFFADTNFNDAEDPARNPNTNLCNSVRNSPNSTCGEDGPTSPDACVVWFRSLWTRQAAWLEKKLAESTTDWQLVVTHFPPETNFKESFALWKHLSTTYGIDLIITGHRHNQEVHVAEEGSLQTAFIVTGGGGGITSEKKPDIDGKDDQYGFMDVTLSKAIIKIEAISHGGVLRSTTIVEPHVGTHPQATSTSTSTTTTSTSTATSSTSTTSSSTNTITTTTTSSSTNTTTTMTTSTSVTATTTTTGNTTMVSHGEWEGVLAKTLGVVAGIGFIQIMFIGFSRNMFFEERAPDAHSPTHSPTA